MFGDIYLYTGTIFSAKTGTRKSGEANSAGLWSMKEILVLPRSSNLFGKNPREVHSFIVKMTAPAVI